MMKIGDRIISAVQKKRFTDISEREKTSISTKEGMRHSVKWNAYREELKSGIRSGSMKGRKNPNLGKSMKYAMHVRWHVKRNIINEGCEYCVSNKY